MRRMTKLQALEPLAPEDLDRIHESSLDILERIGVRILQDETLEMLRRNGAEVSRETRIAKLPRALAQESLKKAPSEFSVTPRNPKNDFKASSKPDKTRFGFGHGLWVSTGKGIRAATSSDVENWARLYDSLKNAYFIYEMYPSDIHSILHDRYNFKAQISNTSKVVYSFPMSKEGARDIIEMASAVVGGEEELMKRPIFMTGEAVTPPLEWGKKACDGFMETAKYNIPCEIASEPTAGATSPVTIAGTLVLSNAEILSGIVINQLWKKGRPVIYMYPAHIMNMRTTAAMSGCPWDALQTAAAAQMARYYNLPSKGYFASDSKLADAQSAYEKALLGLMQSLSGNTFVGGMGHIDMLHSVSYEQAVIDDEIVGALDRIVQGIEFTEDTLAIELIEKVGMGGNYLKEIHTAKHYAKEDSIITISDKRERRKWEKLGSKDLTERASEKVKEILSTHEPEPLPSHVQEALAAIMKRAQKSMPNKYGNSN